MIATEFKNHAIHQKILEISSRFNDEKTKKKIEPETLLFFKSHLQFLTERLKLCIIPIVNEDEINAITNELQNALSQINEFLGNNNIAHLSAAKVNFTSISPFARNLPVLINKADFNFSEVTANFEAHNNSLIERNKHQLLTLETNFQGMTNLLNEKQNQLNDLQNELKRQETQSHELTDKFRLQLQEINQRFDQNTTLITNAQKEQFTATKLSFEQESKQHISELNSLKMQAKQILNVIGEDATASHHKKTAQEHTKMANIFRMISLLIMISICIFIIWLITTTQGEFNWQRYLFRLVSISIFIYPATYAAKESSKHRNLATENERAALELAALGPFIELLDNDKKQEIKEKMVDKFFGKEFNQPKNSPPTEDPSSSEITTTTLDLVERLAKIFKT